MPLGKLPGADLGAADGLGAVDPAGQRRQNDPEVLSIPGAPGVIQTRVPATDAQIARIHAPIGLDLGGRRPEEIAVAIMAQIVQVVNRKEDGGMTG